MGVMAKAARSSVQSSTPTRKMTSRKAAPIIAMSTVATAMLAAANVRRRNKRSSSIGVGTRSSQNVNPVRVTTATANKPSTRSEVQPHSLAWMMARVRQKRPAETRMMPA